MKKGLLILAALLIIGLPVIAGPQGEDAADTSAVIKVGISKIVDHPALNAVEQGIQDELAAQGIEAEYDLQNANGESATAAAIAAKFKEDQVDFAVGIATPTAQALVNKLVAIPVIYSAVTDPVEAGLVDSFDEGGMNVTGTSDMTPVKDQIKLLIDLTGATKIGHVYSSNETNGVTLAAMAREACEELGVEFIESTVTKVSEVREAAIAIVDRVDAFYVSTDNTVVSGIAALSAVANDAGKAVMSADPSSSLDVDVLAAWGFDYYKMGRATGRIIADITRGKKTSEIPTQFMTSASDIQLLVNLDVAAALGVTIPQDLIDNAAYVIQNGAVTEK